MTCERNLFICSLLLVLGWCTNLSNTNGEKTWSFLNLFLLRRQGSFLLKPCRGSSWTEATNPKRNPFQTSIDKYRIHWQKRAKTSFNVNQPYIDSLYHLKNRSGNQEYEGEVKQAQRISTNMDSFYPSNFHESTVKIHGLRDPVWPRQHPQGKPYFSSHTKTNTGPKLNVNNTCADSLSLGQCQTLGGLCSKKITPQRGWTTFNNHVWTTLE